MNKRQNADLSVDSTINQRYHPNTKKKLNENGGISYGKQYSKGLSCRKER